MSWIFLLVESTSSRHSIYTGIFESFWRYSLLPADRTHIHVHSSNFTNAKNNNYSFICFSSRWVYDPRSKLYKKLASGLHVLSCKVVYFGKPNAECKALQTEVAPSLDKERSQSERIDGRTHISRRESQASLCISSFAGIQNPVRPNRLTIENGTPCTHYSIQSIQVQR